jgi:DASH complex subunit ASK1
MRETPKPGMSVLTPAKKSAGKSAMWDSDDDLDYDNDDLGPSPPKTMQFHIPQSRLMRTPGKLETLSLAFQSMKLTFFFKPRKLLSV